MSYGIAREIPENGEGTSKPITGGGEKPESPLKVEN
jgi:hypothetical protein